MINILKQEAKLNLQSSTVKKNNLKLVKLN